MGWIGIASQLKYALSVVGADRDKDGNPLLVTQDEHGFSEPGPWKGLPFFMAMFDESNDVVVGNDIFYCVNGKPAATVASLMNATSYGVRNITVIC